MSTSKLLKEKVGTMKGFVSQVILLLALLTVLTAGSAFALSIDEPARVGLSYGSGALAAANLENSVGKGFRFGCYDSQNRFVAMGSTQETQITMLKTQNLYLTSGGSYSTSASGGGLVGCFHLQLNGTFASAQDAQSKAASVENGFPAWVSGSFYVRSGSYATQAEAESALRSSGLDASVVGTSSSGITVVKSKTTKILFQYDDPGGSLFAVKPGANGEEKTQTWFKGNKYAGSFLYERLNGGNMTVMNLVSLDDYVKGLVPYEMSSSWPIEALKAQAVTARTFILATAGTKHSNYHFDICNTTCCQVYQGCGRATANSDAAVDATSGICVWYDGKLATTYYYASNGGATESCQNVWFANLPYIVGKADPFEADVADSVSGYYWTKTYTSAELTSRLQSRGYSCGNIVKLVVSQFTPTGNVYSVTFTDNAGKTFVFSKADARSILGVKSMHFNIAGSGSAPVPDPAPIPEPGASDASGGGPFYVDSEENSLASLNGAAAVNGSGTTETIRDASQISIITSAGTEVLGTTVSTTEGTSTSAIPLPGSVTTPRPIPTAPAGSFVISGAGNGHNVGMSQWGAYAMAKRGYNYKDILNFYYTGIDLH